MSALRGKADITLMSAIGAKADISECLTWGDFKPLMLRWFISDKVGKLNHPTNNNRIKKGPPIPRNIQSSGSLNFLTTFVIPTYLSLLNI